MADYVKGSAMDPNPERRAKRQAIEDALIGDLVAAGGGDEFSVASVVAGIVYSYLTTRNTYAFDFVLSVGGDAVAEMLIQLGDS